VPLLAAPIAAVFVGVRLNRDPLKRAGDAKNAKFSFIPSLSLFLSALRAFAVKLAFWPLVAGLLTLSVFNAALIFLEPKYAYKESPIKFYEEATRWQIRPYLPALGTRTMLAVPLPRSIALHGLMRPASTNSTSSLRGPISHGAWKRL